MWIPRSLRSCRISTQLRITVQRVDILVPPVVEEIAAVVSSHERVQQRTVEQSVDAPQVPEEPVEMLL